MKTVNTTEDAAFGAALLEGEVIGVWPDVDKACETVTKVTGSSLPDAKSVASYEGFYNIYRKLYPALHEINDALSVCPRG